MKIDEVTPVRLARNRNRKAYEGVSMQGTTYPTYPTDYEKEAIVVAMKFATIYAGAVIRFDGMLDQVEALKSLNEFVKGLDASNFCCYCILRPEVTTTEYDHLGDTSFVCWILFKTMGSSIAAFPKSTTLPSGSEIRFISDYVQVQRELVASLAEFCEGAVCIAVAGNGGIVPLWDVDATHLGTHARDGMRGSAAGLR